MLALASLALLLAAGLLVGGYAVARTDGIDHRRTVVVTAALLAAGGVTAGAMPASVAPSPEPTAAPAPTPTAEATAVVDADEAASGGAHASDASTVENATVVAVSAPDRLTYRTESGARRTIRLAGVDAPGLDGADPEAFDGVLTGDRGRRCLADHGRRALVDLRTDLLGERIAVDATGQAVGTETATVTVDGRLLNRRLVERGEARATGERYADAERAARSARRGVWSCGVVEPDRSGTTALRIAAVHPNPPDDATPGLGEEFIVIENTGERAVDLSGWYLVVDDTHYYFFDGRRLQPGAELTVHVGTGRDTEGHVYWAAGHPILGDGGGTIGLVVGDEYRTVRLSY